MLSTGQMSVSCVEVEFILSPTKARSPCLQRACKVRDTHIRCKASMCPLRHAYICGTGQARWRHGCRDPGWHWICICRSPKLYRQRTSDVHRRALHARVCYVPTGDAAHAAVIAHCSITAAGSLRAPASLKRRTGDVRRWYGSLRFGYRIRRRPATERCTAGCDRGISKVSAASCLAELSHRRANCNKIVWWPCSLTHQPDLNMLTSLQLATLHICMSYALSENSTIFFRGGWC